MTDPRLMVYGPTPDGQPRPAQITYDSQRQRHTVRAMGTLDLGYIYAVELNSAGEPVKPHVPTYAGSVPVESVGVRHVYRATDRHGNDLGDPVEAVADAAALIVGAAHSNDPDPEHVVPRNVGGRPAIGKPVNLRLGDLLARVDAVAAERGRSRADTIRDLVEQALRSLDGAANVGHDT